MLSDPTLNGDLTLKVLGKVFFCFFFVFFLQLETIKFFLITTQKHITHKKYLTDAMRNYNLTTLKAPITTAAEGILILFFFFFSSFSKKIDFDISCDSSAW